MSHTDPSGNAKTGTLDGTCEICGAPTRRMGWLNWPADYWLMCTASGQVGDATPGGCDLPTLEKAKLRLKVEPRGADR